MKKLQCVPGLVLFLFLGIGVSSDGFALEVPVFPPLRYSIDTVQGTAVYTDTVQMGNVASGEFHLIVQNGAHGKNAVDLGEIAIDGKRLVKLTQKKNFKDKKFKLVKDSTLQVSLTGPKDSFVVVSVIAKKLTQVPLVIRMPQADAQTAMTNALLKVGKKPIRASHGFVPEGSVIAQTPAPGVYVKEKTKASITVSTGPALAYNLLPGTPDTPASSAVVDYNSYDTVAEGEIEELPSGVKIIRTKLEIGFIPTATVQEVNDLLISIGGQITAMRTGVNQVIVRIVDPGNIAALDTLISQIESSPIVRYVLKSYIPSPSVLPPNVDLAAEPGLKVLVDHHLDVRAHAAWNVKDLITQNFSPPSLMVVDWFGDGKPNADFAVGSSADEFATGKLNTHGYHVLGIIAATFGGRGDERGWATGMYPGYLPLWVIDMQKGYGWDEMLMIPMVAELLGGRVIVNTSLGWGCSEGTCDKSSIEPAALSWIEKVRGSGLYETGLTGPESLENTFLHLTAAGNIEVEGDTDAAFEYPFTAARLLPTLTIPGVLTPVLNLTNTLVIENRQKSPEPLEGLGCIDPDSKFPGDLSAIGTNVWSLTGASAGADYKSGTSMATPQVTGLAAYLWALDSSLTPQGIMDILTRTADSTNCGGTNPRPLIDAYAAVLALDRGIARAKIRRALLDVADREGNPGSDRHFTDKDIEAFLGRFEAANGAKDYSRYDLNGDGKTGGDLTAKFNLDMDYPPSYTETVHQIIDGPDITFNENELTDLDILCYYAYSRLYTGDTDRRKDLLRDRCAKVTEELTFPSTISPGSSGELRVRAGYTVPDGSTQWKEGVDITVTVEGGSADPSTGTTDADGYFSTTIQHDGLSESITVTATATDSGGREVTKTATAATGPLDPVYITWARSITHVYEECTGTHVCDDIYALGQYDSYVPISLPVNIGTSCSPYAQSAVTVERVAPEHITVSASMTAVRVHEDADPPPCDEYVYLPDTSYDIQGRITGGRTYIVEVSPSILLIQGPVRLQFGLSLAYGSPPIYSIVCERYGGAATVACTTDGQNWTPPPVAIEVDAPDGILYWAQSYMVEFPDSPGGTTSLSGRVLSIREK